MKKILVTGDRGYVGSVLVPLLLKKRYDVVGYDSHYFTKTLGKNENYSYKKITKDVRDVTLYDLRGIDIIIHLAALSNDASGELNPQLTHEINYLASVKLAKLAKKAGVKRFIFSSSCSIYGKFDGVADEESPIHPLTAYAKSKVATEKILQKIADKQFCVAILRNSTLYGYAPKFRNDLVVNNLTTIAFAYNEIQIASDGTPWRPLLDVRDLARIFLGYITVDDNKVNGKIINVGFSENNYQVKNVASIIYSILPNCKITYTGQHPDSRSYKVEFSKFEKIFPTIKPIWGLKKSVKDMVRELQKANYRVKDFEEEKFVRLAILKKLKKNLKIDSNLRFITNN